MDKDLLSRVLYVDDDPDIRMVVRLALETVGGLTVLVCGSGQEALEKADGFGPNLIVLDVLMPDMDGPTTLAALRQGAGTGETPVIFMTARAHKEEISRLKALGAIGVVPKPFDPMELSTTLKALWNARRDGTTPEPDRE